MCVKKLSSQCKSKRVTLALFGRSSHFRNLRLWLKRQCSSVFCVSSAAVEFKSLFRVSPPLYVALYPAVQYIYITRIIYDTFIVDLYAFI